MKYIVSHESRCATTKCPSGFSCLTGEKTDLCAVETSVDGEVRIIKCLNDSGCSYRHPFGRGDLCMCPVRQEINKTYKI